MWIYNTVALHTSICTVMYVKQHIQICHAVLRNSFCSIFHFVYGECLFELESMEQPHECILLDKPGLNLTKLRKRDYNIICQRAVLELLGQRGVNVTLCGRQQLRGSPSPR